MIRRETSEQCAENDAAYELGWTDSLGAHWYPGRVEFGLGYWYKRGWDACADYRWRDPARRGVAEDRAFRIPRDPRS